MSTESIKEMEDRWHILMSAKDSHTGERIYDKDPKYRRDVFALRTQIEERKKSEAPGAQIAADQLKQIAWVNRAQGAVGKDGKRLTEAAHLNGTKNGNTFVQSLDKARAILSEGKLLAPGYIADSERWIAAQGATMPPEKAAQVYDHTPIAAPVQATTSFIAGR